MSKYNPLKIEQKWQDYWDNNKIFLSKTNKNLKNEIDKLQINPYVKNLSKLNEENFDNNNLEKEDLNKESKNKIKNSNFSWFIISSNFSY